MARIKITDLPKEIKISKEEMRRTMGGLLSSKGGRIGIRTIPGIRASNYKRIEYPIGNIYLRRD